MSITYKTHFNPCFWTAFWNKEYYEDYQKNPTINKDCRRQTVYCLNLRSDKILRTIVENVHFEKGLGTSEITPDGMRDYCRRVFPEKYIEFNEYLKSHPEVLVLDFENFFSAIEKDPYEPVMDVIQKEKITTKEEKANIACFIRFCEMRNPAIMNSMIAWESKKGFPRFEHFIWLKYVCSNPPTLFNMVLPLMVSKWTLYKTKDHAFPLGDLPVLREDRNIMVALSPRLLLEIDSKVNARPEIWTEKDGIPESKLKEFMVRTISCSSTEIIFSNKETLAAWQKTKAYRNRINSLLS